MVVDGKTLQTKPVVLKVQKEAGQKRGAARGGNSDPGDANGAAAFAEIVVEKKNVYVGEAVPMEFKFYVDNRIRLGEVGNFDLNGEGFTVQKAGKPEEREEKRGGNTYRVWSFRSILTPGKAGKLKLGPSQIPFIAQMPLEGRGQRNRRMSPLERFFDDDFFGPPRWKQPQRYNAEAAAVEIEVKPLPAEGRPKEFSGAVGQFQFTAETPTTRVKTGEPVTMRLRITGEGNFDRVSAPVLTDPQGWQAYDASESFEPSNELKNSGTKIFEMPVVPQVAHDQTPQFAFVYFDPRAEKYVTQTSQPTPLVVEGQPAAPPTPSLGPAQSASNDKTNLPAEAQGKPSAPAVIAPLSYDLGPIADFRQIHQRSLFWLVHAAAGVLAIGLLASRLLRRDPEQRRAIALRRERDHLLRELRNGRTSEDFFESAARALQLATACKTGVDPSCVDAPAAKSALAREDTLAAQIDAIFDRRGALVYAGGAAGGELSAPDRNRVIAAVEQACAQ